MTLGSPRLSRRISLSQDSSLNHTCQVSLPLEVMYDQVLGIRMWMSLGTIVLPAPSSYTWPIPAEALCVFSLCQVGAGRTRVGRARLLPAHTCMWEGLVPTPSSHDFCPLALPFTSPGDLETAV